MNNSPEELQPLLAEAQRQFQTLGGREPRYLFTVCGAERVGDRLHVGILGIALSQGNTRIVRPARGPSALGAIFAAVLCPAG
ncbi:MAG TPA: hypothetical protein VEG34_11475 [Thermoanaerobaculia bacterium]|nr:hypothetical protein [Thermoanaerobaculia bacterium]